MNYYLAVDIGASSGRHILAYSENGKIKYEEIHRFKNGLIDKNGSQCWDLEYLFAEIKRGLRKCKEIGKIPVSVSVDTWGVDFILLDSENNIIGDSVGYRDRRTDGIPEIVFKLISEAELYHSTGIQCQKFNTLFQLYAIKTKYPENIENASCFLMLPDYFNFLLTGIKANEYTEATTSGMVSAITGEWDLGILNALGIKKSLFLPLKPAGTRLGCFSGEIAAETGFNADVILAPSHDTASAVLAVPYAENAVYISSGTWSLTGIESEKPFLCEESCRSGFTNEGGYGGKFRFLKNIMGLWMLQSVRREFSEKGDAYSFNDLSEAAEKCRDFGSFVDVTASCFLSPESMTAAIQDFCVHTKQKPPESIGEICAVIYRSLADCYAKTTAEIEKLTGKIYNIINIVGGGSRDEYLNKLTAEFSGKKVVSGPAEATALGNALTQMITAGEIKNSAEAREMIKRSFEFKTYGGAGKYE